jgi:REP element-mobilizing transposase RayT
MSDFEFVDPRTTPFVEPRSRGELPHLYKEFGTYFVTFRLWDAVIPGQPAPKAAAWRNLTPREILDSSEPALQAGSCLLAENTVAELVQRALLHFDGVRYCLLAWCIMPNHVHVIFQPFGEWSPSSILHTWKSFTSHEANKLLGRKGRLWERETFDHLIRSVDDLERFIAYVERNPVEARLCHSPSLWRWSSASRRRKE